MITLGIWDGHSASATLIADGNILAAVAEERITRAKMQRGFPVNAIKAVLSLAGVAPADVERVAVGGHCGRAPMRLLNSAFSARKPGKGPLQWPARLYRHYENRIGAIPGIRRVEAGAGRLALRSRLALMGIEPAQPLVLVPHHTAHAASAATLFRSPAFIVTIDGYGDGLSASCWNTKDGRLCPVGSRSYLHSVAVTYASVCQILGYQEGDEGKVTALAAHGDPEALQQWFASLLSAPKTGPLARRHVRHLERYNAPDIAAGMQAAMEQQVLALITQVVPRNTRNLGLAGGLFANVSLNRKLSLRYYRSNIRVFPAMGDDGLSLGAAVFDTVDQGQSLPRFPGPFLGMAPDTTNLQAMAAKHLLDCRDSTNAAREAAQVLATGGTVACVSGREEFGPRALGNRSLLFQATSTQLADNVQTMLSRNPVMPFAPVCLPDNARQLVAGQFPARERSDYGLDLMTFAVQLRSDAARTFPAAVHLDGTARLQVAAPNASPLLAEILTHYRQATGHPLLINTSFNLHRDPIVHDTQDALDTFVRAGVDCMVLGSYVVSRTT